MNKEYLIEKIFRRLTAGQCSSILDELEEECGTSFRTTRRLLCWCKSDLENLLNEEELLKSDIKGRYCPHYCKEHIVCQYGKNL